MTSRTARPYNGVENEERVALRRDKLLQAGLDILSDPLGDDDLTLRVICRRAGLAQRYFYESFTDKDELAATVYDWVLAGVIGSTQDALLEATPTDGLRIGLTQVVESVTADPRVGQLLFNPHQDNAVVVRKRFESTSTFVGLFSSVLPVRYRPDPAGRAPMIAHFLVGGVAQALAAWLNGDTTIGKQEFVDDLVDMVSVHGIGRRRTN